MEFILQRFSDNRESTLGLLFSKVVHEGITKPYFICYTLEDQAQPHKVKGETRIPAGKYSLGIRKEDTPLTLKYQKRFPWFTKHIEILNIPNFQGVYIHVGNSDIDTDGCILLGDNADNNNLSRGGISNSVQAFNRFYRAFFEAIEKGGCTIEIRDESHLLK